MVKREQEEIKSTIEREILKTEKQIKEFKELTKPISPDNSIGRLSRMDAINNRSVNESSLRKAEERLKNLKRVLNQAGTDDFGRCLKCRKQIPLQRILIRPESLYCVNCAN